MIKGQIVTTIRVQYMIKDWIVNTRRVKYMIQSWILTRGLVYDQDSRTTRVQPKIKDSAYDQESNFAQGAVYDQGVKHSAYDQESDFAQAAVYDKRGQSVTRVQYMKKG
jgi:hypothetical protein